MGVLFIAAGTSSKNREKTLERSYTLPEIKQFLQTQEVEYLRSFFPDEQGIYLWGANRKNLDQLSQVRKGEYAVDVKNKKVIQVFHFCFFIETADALLQDFVGWDSEKAKANRRPYKYVYFLKSPLVTTRNEKEFFQDAFNQGSNRNWLVGQRYFNDHEVSSAIQRTSCSSVESFLGIDLGNSVYIPKSSPPVTKKNSGYIPIKADADKALLSLGGKNVKVEDLLDRIQVNCLDLGLQLKTGWRKITEQNILNNWGSSN